MLAAAVAVALVAAAPADPYADVRSAARAADAGRLLEAEERLRRALAAAPDLAEAHQNLGAVLHRLGRYDEAETSFRAALERAPEMREARLGLGLAALAAGRPASAAEAFRAILVDRPNDVDALIHLGWALLRMDSPVAAGRVFERAIILTPRPGPRLGLALAREARGDLDGAAEAAAEAVGADSRDAAAAYHRGRLAWRLGRLDEARAALERAVALDPAGPAAAVLARVEIAAGRAATAAAAAETAEAAAGASGRRPPGPAAAALRAHAVEARGPAPDATAAWRIALDRDPADEVLRHRLEEAIVTSDRPDTAGREALGRWRLAAAGAARARGDLWAERRHLGRAVFVAPLLDEVRAARARHLEATGFLVEAIGEWGLVIEITRDPILLAEAGARRAALGRRAILEWEAVTGRVAPGRAAHAGDAAEAVGAGALDRAFGAAGGDPRPPRPALLVAVRAPAAALHPGVDRAVAVEVADLLADRYDARPRGASGAAEDDLLAEARAAGADLFLVDLEAEGRERIAGRLRLFRTDPLRPGIDLAAPILAEGPGAFGAAVLAAVRRVRAIPLAGRVVDLAPGRALVAGGRAHGIEAGLDVVFTRPGDVGEGEAVVGRGRVAAATATLASVRLEEGSALPGDAVLRPRTLPRRVEE